MRVNGYEETQEWEDTYTFILPEEYDSYSFGVYTDTHDKQFYWDGEAFTEEASVSKVYDFEEMKDVPLSYDGYDADLPIRIQDFQYHARYGYGTLKYFYDSDFPSGDFTIYVAVYDEHKRLKEVVTSNLCMEQAKSQELPVKFSNPLEETDIIKMLLDRPRVSSTCPMRRVLIVQINTDMNTLS